jgi:excisionase family DNA binding protein
MLYHIESVIKRLQESDRKEPVTEQELLRLATPHVNQIGQIVELLQKAVADGYTGSYTVGETAKYTSVSRRTLYRWLQEGIIRQDDAGKISITKMLKELKIIEKRQNGKG